MVGILGGELNAFLGNLVGKDIRKIFFCFAVFIASSASLFFSNFHSLEGKWYDYVFIVGASVLTAALVVIGWKFSRGWRLLKRILDQLENHPIRQAFSDFPVAYSWSPIWQSNPRTRNYALMGRSREVLKKIKAGANPKNRLPSVNNIDIVLMKVASGQRETMSEYRDAQSTLQLAADILITELASSWMAGSSEILEEAVKKEVTKEAAKPTKLEFDDSKPYLIKAEFVALRYLAFIRYVMLQLRNFLTFITLGFLSLAFAFMVYPFQGERLLGWHLTLIFAALAILVSTVFAQMELDPTLSRITNSSAGKLGSQFFTRSFSYLVLPLITVLASHFSGVSRLLFSWIQPALKSLH